MLETSASLCSLPTTKINIPEIPFTIHHTPPMTTKTETQYLTLDQQNDHLQKWIGYATSGAIDRNSIVVAPLEPNTKRPLEGSGVKVSVNHPEDKRWNWKRASTYFGKMGSEKREQLEKHDLGVYIKNDVAVLDFDKKETLDWFVKQFDFPLDKYLHYTSAEKHTGGHIWFKMDEEIKSTPRYAGIWTDDDGNPLDIDFKRQYNNGTPALVKVPYNTAKKVWVNHNIDDLLELPDNVKDYFSAHQYQPPTQSKIKTNSSHALSIVGLLPNDFTFQTAQWKRAVIELWGQGISKFDIFGWSKALPQSTLKSNGVPHFKYFNDYWDSINFQQADKSFTLIPKLARDNRAEEYQSYMTKYVNNTTTLTFSIRFLKDICKFIPEFDARKFAVMNYYNRFFVRTTGCSKNVVLIKKYKTNGTIKDIVEFQSAGDFTKSCSIKAIFDEGGKSIATADWWFSETDNTYDNVVFQPYGIKNFKGNPTEMNMFPGYNLAYQPAYSNISMDDKGDAIDNHMREVLCADHDHFYKFMRKWIYLMVAEGVRPKVSLVFYTPEFGTGKSLWIEGFATNVIGEGLFTKCPNFLKMMKDQFTNYTDNKTLLVLEEMPEHSHQNKDFWDELKSLTEDATIVSRGFMKAPTRGDNHLNMWIITNHHNSIDPGYADRRAAVQRCSPKHKDDVEYFAYLADACNDPEAWENWFHRHIINRYAEFKDTEVKSMSSCIPDTMYRRQILKKNIDNILYFFKYLLYDSGYNFYNEEAPAGSQFDDLIDRYLLVEHIWSEYRDWVAMKNMSDWINNEQKFYKELTARLQCEIYYLTEKSSKVDKKKLKTIPRKHTNKGNAIHFTKELVDTLIGAIKKSCITPLDNRREVSDDDILDLATSTHSNPYGLDSDTD